MDLLDDLRKIKEDEGLTEEQKVDEMFKYITETTEKLPLNDRCTIRVEAYGIIRRAYSGKENENIRRKARRKQKKEQETLAYANVF